MSYIRSKTIKGNQYLYEQESYRENGSVRTRHIQYIGVDGRTGTTGELGTTQDNKLNYCGTCDKIRQTEKGEKFWNEMIKNKKEITETEFKKHVNPKDALDKDESFTSFKEQAKREGTPLKYYESKGNYYFKYDDFEYIWRKENETK